MNPSTDSLANPFLRNTLVDTKQTQRASLQKVQCSVFARIDGYYEILERDLRDGERLAIVDFRKDIEIERGPDKVMRIARQALIDEVSAAGFRLVDEHEFLPVQYFLVFEAP